MYHKITDACRSDINYVIFFDALYGAFCNGEIVWEYLLGTFLGRQVADAGLKTDIA